jgi:hypothetical protein
MCVKHKKINDYTVFLKCASELYSDNEAVLDVLQKVYVKYKNYFKNDKLTKKRLDNLWTFIEIINTFDENDIITQGEKIVNGR